MLSDFDMARPESGRDCLICAMFVVFVAFGNPSINLGEGGERHGDGPERRQGDLVLTCCKSSSFSFLLLSSLELSDTQSL